ncbi:MAG TPA: tetratricopeptide repeat protein, partial [Candidatus Obscuribacter sp.]|nr:tetratricopeptide repeat protein [Candidatus Obscuribacter sp.]
MAIKAFRRPGTVVALVLALSFGLCSALTPALAQSDDFERLKAAVEKARQAGKKDDLALKLYTLGQTLAEARKFEEALTYLREALSVDRGLAKSKEVFNDLIAIARVETHAKQFEQAEKTYLEALAVAKDTGSEKQLASVYAGLGANAIHAKKFEEARTFYEKSREEAARSSDYVGECQARLSLAMLLKREGKLAEALKELEAARALLGDNTQEAFVGQV